MTQPSELYIHIPFCVRKCAYCDFVSYPGQTDFLPAYLDALILEARREAEKLRHPAVDTVFIGGGTPSLLSPEQIRELFSVLRSEFDIRPDAEITCECNPGTLTEPLLDTMREAGVNRLSMGAQASQEELLKRIGRIHTWCQVEEGILAARKAGFTNLSLDLMFALPGQTVKDVEETVQRALALPLTHLSCYSLIVEEGTPLEKMVADGQWTLPDEDTERDMHAAALRLLKEAGFERYEISNYARPGFECRHNLGYWAGVPYLGLGCAAHSMLPCDPLLGAYLRRGNTPDLHGYVDRVNRNESPADETEYISNYEAIFETMMMGLRTTRGISEADFLLRHGIPLRQAYGEQLRRFTDSGMVVWEDGHVRLSEKGIDFENTVLVELMDD